MEVTNEIRAKIFALYMGCKCISDPNGEEPQEYIVNGETLMAMEIYPKVSDDVLLLKNISSITDEDAIGLMQCHSSFGESETILINSIVFNNNALIIDYYYGGNKSYGRLDNFTTKETDYLRSKSYALPYMGIDLFESGIAIDPSTITDKSK